MWGFKDSPSEPGLSSPRVAGAEHGLGLPCCHRRGSHAAPAAEHMGCSGSTHDTKLLFVQFIFMRQTNENLDQLWVLSRVLFFTKKKNPLVFSTE